VFIYIDRSGVQVTGRLSFLAKISGIGMASPMWAEWVGQPPLGSYTWAVRLACGNGVTKFNIGGFTMTTVVEDLGPWPRS
jgi:hypothetical protein